MTKWNCSISWTPTRIAKPRMTSASTIPQNSSFPRCAWGTAKAPKISRKTNRLSSDSVRSIR